MTDKEKLTANQCFARARAYEACADHLALSWTDDDLELIEWNKLESRFRQLAEEWRNNGNE
jgi:hypothetical protein